MKQVGLFQGSNLLPREGPAYRVYVCSPEVNPAASLQWYISYSESLLSGDLPQGLSNTCFPMCSHLGPRPGQGDGTQLSQRPALVRTDRTKQKQNVGFCVEKRV